MAYEVGRLKAAMGVTSGEWTLRDLLAYGSQEELVAAVLDKALEGPARDLAIRVLPLQALLVGIFDRLPQGEATPRLRGTTRAEDLADYIPGVKDRDGKGGDA